jgi:geranylgeranyl diphosphate synthase, type II
MNTVFLERYQSLVEEGVDRWVHALPSGGLYEPMAYLMRLPAKRIRPAALLMCCDMAGGDIRQALDPAVGIEIFHNFTLMHDDIMDQAPLRRGHDTVHVKWDVNTAILSGDAMLVKAFEAFTRHTGTMEIFIEHALAVCEGQRSDMEFEQRQNVSLPEYMEMIRRKTAMLLSCSMRIGAVLGGASPKDVGRVAEFGEHLGLAFQLRDDLLDAFGDPDKVGKATGGDLRAGKKTWLLIRGLELEQASGGGLLSGELRKGPAQRNIPAMLKALQELGARQDAEEQVAFHEGKAQEALDMLDVSTERKEPLTRLADLLMARTY